MAVNTYHNGAFQDAGMDVPVKEIDISASVANFLKNTTSYPAARLFYYGKCFTIEIGALTKNNIPQGDVVISDILPIPEIAISRGFFHFLNARFGSARIRNGKIELVYYGYSDAIPKETYITASVFGFFV